MHPVTEANALLRNRAGLARDKVGTAVQARRERIELRVHKHPLQTVLVSAGTGLLVGLAVGLFRRRSRE